MGFSKETMGFPRKTMRFSRKTMRFSRNTMGELFSDDTLSMVLGTMPNTLTPAMLHVPCLAPALSLLQPQQRVKQGHVRLPQQLSTANQSVK